MSSTTRSLPVRVFRYFWHQWRDDLTPAGKIVFWGMCVTGLGTIELQMPIYQLFFGLVALISVGATAGAIFRPFVSIESDFPERAAAGQSVVARVSLRNLRRIPAYDVGANVLGLSENFDTNLDENLIARLGPGEWATIPVVLTAKRRGRYQLPRLRAYSSFPFALGRSGKVSQPLPELLVTPKFEPLIALNLPTSHHYHPGGTTLISHVGESPEYIGNREYIPGEPVRRLDFRAWARLGKPVVREYQEEFHTRVGIILDTFVPTRGRRTIWQLQLEQSCDEGNTFVPTRGGRATEESAELEAAISLAAALASAYSKGESVIDLLAIGPTWHALASRAREGRFEELLGLLADVRASAEDPFREEIPRRRGELRGLASVVVILLSWSERRKEALDEIAQHGTRLKTILIVPNREQSSIPTAEIPACTVLETGEIARGGLSIHW